MTSYYRTPSSLSILFFIVSFSMNSSIISIPTQPKQTKEAILKKMTGLTNELIQTRLDLAQLYNEEQLYDLALEQFDYLLTQQPNHINYLFQRANVLNTMNRTDEALIEYQRLLEKYPDNTSILYNTAYTLKKLGRLQDAKIYYENVLKQNPDHTEAHFGLGLACLISGDFTRGWKEYEYRWQRSDYINTQKQYTQPLWDGSPLEGKRIFLYGEQGLGDTYQFIRYAREAKKRGGYVIVGVQNPLMQIIKLCPYIDEVVSLNAQPPQFDVYAPLMSLPFILKTTVETVPDKVPYLYADETLVKTWKERLSTDKNFKIGVCWQGNDKYSTAFLRTVVAAKSIKVKQFAQFGTIENLSIYNLQKETGTEQLNNNDHGFNLISFDGDFDASNGRFMDTAAVIKNLDLVITVDTSIAHLAAGLGTPTWTFIPNPPDWRWMLNRNTTPWYPNMRLFRQPEPGDWQSVIDTITHELKLYIRQKTDTQQS